MTWRHTHIHMYVVGALLLGRWGACVQQSGGKHPQSVPLSLSVFYLLGLCSLPPKTGLRSHYILLIPVADSGGTVRDCKGKGEEGEREDWSKPSRASCRDRG